MDPGKAKALSVNTGEYYCSNTHRDRDEAELGRVELEMN
jgi:hypothetical protein